MESSINPINGDESLIWLDEPVCHRESGACAIAKESHIQGQVRPRVIGLHEMNVLMNEGLTRSDGGRAFERNDSGKTWQSITLKDLAPDILEGADGMDFSIVE